MTLPDEGDERSILADDDEHLFRQILLPLRDGRPTWEAFKGRKDEDWQVSVDRESVRSSAEAAHVHYTSGGANSNGVLATTVGALAAEQVEAYEAELEDNPAHCQYDLAAFQDGSAISHSKRERVCIKLYEASLADEQHPPYLP